MHVNLIGKVFLTQYQGCGPAVDSIGSGSGSGSGHDFYDIKGTGITHLHVYMYLQSYMYIVYMLKAIDKIKCKFLHDHGQIR